MPTIRRPSILAGRLAIVLFALLVGAFAAPRDVHAQPGGGHEHHGQGARDPKADKRHPAPRPGITAANVLSAEVVPERARDAYTIAARIPEVFDGLFCYCDCHERDGKRSLLECYEDDMATTCGICQGEARLVGELHAQGKTLAEIRAAIDARYGD
ncbi:CYCXC family (seleno)protein [Longimicrobium sp.]|uniref:CYCXC family (seleno)protein n=1 Tax=Longimicrobium sp. TaxID=2029185 RepID=UPI002E316798|nr:CYCXC family (seleno)protein [Longimicrobium sp.]HEX6041320.1 CYCXC family (seleno)protein [Longimicrobium sp.]